MNLNFPPGYVFAPTDEQLIVHFLQKKVNGEFVNIPMIKHDNIYLYNPWQLIEKYPLQRYDKGCLYFFTPLYKLSEGGNKRPSRSAGDGHYRTSRSYPIISSQGNQIGYTTHLKFYMGKPSNKDNEANKTNWLLTEYRLTKEGNHNKNIKTLDECVMYKLYYNGDLKKEAHYQHIAKRRKITTTATTEEEEKGEELLQSNQCDETNNKHNMDEVYIPSPPLSQQQQQQVPQTNDNAYSSVSQIDQSVEEWENEMGITLDDDTLTEQDYAPIISLPPPQQQHPQIYQ
ncbi:NAC domain-containing protein 19-like [Cannabis sativa]|uniref:NAC domain-containing protein 19-like n=1 Tax=Cannabis sativa TaxID=3483 RepID=UPI0029CA4CED|nr:NAC domain-containing protein 19-like [Cannabis sativa]